MITEKPVGLPVPGWAALFIQPLGFLLASGGYTTYRLGLHNPSSPFDVVLVTNVDPDVTSAARGVRERFGLRTHWRERGYWSTWHSFEPEPDKREAFAEYRSVAAGLGFQDGVFISLALPGDRHGFLIAASPVFREPDPAFVEQVRVASQMLVTAILSAMREEPEVLTRREIDVLGWVAAGKTSEAIGALLQLTPNTVNSYVQQICSKLGVKSRSQAVAEGFRRGLIF